MTTSPNDYTGQLLTYLQAWRQYLEQATSAATPGAPWPTGTSAPATPPAPPWPSPPTPPVPPPGLISPWPVPAAPPPTPPPPRPTKARAADRAADPVPGERPRPASDGAAASLYSADLATPPPGSMGVHQPRSAFRWAEEPGGAGTTVPPSSRSLYSAPAPPDRGSAASSAVPDQLRGVEEVELTGSDPQV
jgi:hypothetical protein